MSEKKTEKTKETAVKQEERKTAVIYLGPAIPGAAVPGTVYNNGMTSQLKKAVDECPALAKLLVDVKSAGRIRKEIRDPQSAAGVWYQRAAEYAGKKGARG